MGPIDIKKKTIFASRSLILALHLKKAVLERPFLWPTHAQRQKKTKELCDINLQEQSRPLPRPQKDKSQEKGNSTLYKRN